MYTNLKFKKTHPWLYEKWKYFGDILFKSNSYEEFELTCIIRGFVNPPLEEKVTYRHMLFRQPYERFIYSEATGARGKSIMNAKAREFREALVQLDIERGIRDKDGRIVEDKEI